MFVNSFFCGAGGFDLGFIQEGFDIVGAWDFDKYAVQSYAHNIGDYVEQRDVMDMIGSELPSANGWLFGFPCQDISIAGKQEGLINGKKSSMFFEIMRLLGEVETKPSWILAENVKAVKKFIPVIEQEYDKAGYRLIYTMYNSKYENVAQNRERYFLLGIRKDLTVPFQFEKQQTDFIPKLSTFLETNVDEKYYMDDLKALKIVQQSEEGLRIKQATKKGYTVAVEGDTINVSHPNSKTRRGRVGNQVAQTLLTGHEQLVIEPKIEVIGMLDIKGQENIRRVYNAEGLCPTLTTSEGGHRQPKILEQYRVRKLSPREYARLQGFPESYEQVVSNSQFYKQMGNAVTVNVAAFVANQIKEQLEESK